MSTPMISDADHPFNQAVALAPAGEPEEGRFSGAAHAGWFNMLGPFGGITAATALAAVLRHPRLLGTPVSLTVNFLAAVKDAPFEITAVPVRTNRSTQHWTLTLTQPVAEGGTEVMLTGTAVTAVRRETWGATDAVMPADVTPPEQAGRPMRFPGIEWLERYDLRVVHGAPPRVFDDSGEHSLTRLWLRDLPERPLDALSLTAMADAFYPRAWLRRARRVPAGTVSFSVYYHASAAEYAATGSGWVLGQAQAQRFSDNFTDQAVQLWNQAGVLLATSHQLAYYKE